MKPRPEQAVGAPGTPWVSLEAMGPRGRARALAGLLALAACGTPPADRPPTDDPVAEDPVPPARTLETATFALG